MFVAHRARLENVVLPGRRHELTAHMFASGRTARDGPTTRLYTVVIEDLQKETRLEERRKNRGQQHRQRRGLFYQLAGQKKDFILYQNTTVVK